MISRKDNMNGRENHENDLLTEIDMACLLGKTDILLPEVLRRSLERENTWRSIAEDRTAVYGLPPSRKALKSAGMPAVCLSARRSKCARSALTSLT